jgi:Zn-dependent peptidase ImmA (M78 family)
VKLSGIRYRNLKSRVRVADREWFEAVAHRWLQAYADLECYLDLPLKKTASLMMRSAWSDEEMARELRNELDLDEDQPIPSVIDCLERLGIRTIELPTDIAIDGLAAKFGSEYVVVLNSSTSNDRCRMDAAHEAWHILLGDCDSDNADSKDTEKRAFRVGSLFLLPEPKLREAFKGRSLVKLVKFKEQYGISMAAMIYRAQEAKLITQREATWLWREFSVRGWRKKEPGVVRPDRATRFEDMLDSAIRERKLSWQKAESVTGVAESELRQRLKLAMGIKDTADEGGEQPPQILKVFT